MYSLCERTITLIIQDWYIKVVGFGVFQKLKTILTSNRKKKTSQTLDLNKKNFTDV